MGSWLANFSVRYFNKILIYVSISCINFRLYWNLCPTYSCWKQWVEFCEPCKTGWRHGVATNKIIIIMPFILGSKKMFKRVNVMTGRKLHMIISSLSQAIIHILDLLAKITVSHCSLYKNMYILNAEFTLSTIGYFIKEVS